MQATLVGLFVGLMLGLGWAIDGGSGFIAVAFMGAVGFVVGRVIESGDVDLGSIFGSGNQKRQ